MNFNQTEKMHKKIIKELTEVVGKRNIVTSSWRKKVYSKGWRYGSGDAIAVIKPENLIEFWEILNLCVRSNLIIIMQAANTGLTGGSTPNGNNYDRPVLIINTMRINQIQLINSGKQIIGFAGSTLIGLEESLLPYNREPHSVIGSSCIGASIVGGVCNNSGGALVQRGPAYTELSLFAKISSDGKLSLVNELGIDLGTSPIEILNNLQNGKYSDDQIKFPDNLCSDNEYHERVRDVDASSPARFNSDNRRLYGASGCAGKIAVFAVRLDTYPIPKRKKVFYLGSNNEKSFGEIRRHILLKFKNLPISGEYLHGDCYDITKQYCKDTFLLIDKMGSNFIPKLFKLKRKVDLITEKILFFPINFSDRIMQFFSKFLPSHLPVRMENFRNKYEHHWIIEMADEGIEEANSFFNEFFKERDGDFFECTIEESKKALLHRFVAGGAIGRLHAVKSKDFGEMMSMDIALPRNEKNWFEKLPPDIDKLIEVKLYYGHLFCHVLHQNYILKKGVDSELLKSKILKFYDKKGAEYPAEHNVGHEYSAKPTLRKFYENLDPVNVFNPGIGRTSKFKYWK